MRDYDRLVPVGECKDLLERARRLSSDPKVSRRAGRRVAPHFLNLYNMGVFAGGVLRDADRYGRLPEKQIFTLTKKVKFYEAVVNMNEGFEEGFRENVVALVEEIVSVADQVFESRDKRSYHSRRRRIMQTKRTVEDGYLVGEELLCARDLLCDLKGKGVDVRSLKIRLHRAMMRSKLPGQSQVTST